MPAPPTDDDRRRLAASFDSAADIYARARPEYAAAAVEWAVAPGTRRVLDLAAGTGKLTVALVERGLDVVAIDPSPGMLAQLRSTVPGVDARIGTAEAIDLPDGSLDLITIGSALHWFDRPAADFEMARVLRTGGAVATFGNSRDKDVAWVHALDELLRSASDGTPRALVSNRRRLEPSVFGPAQRRAFPYAQRVNADLLVELAASRSYVIEMPEPARTQLLDQVRHLALTHPDLRGRDYFDLPYRTVVSRSIRL